MSEIEAINDLLKEIKDLANQHYASAEVQYYLNTRFTAERARRWAIHQVHFVRHRRDCWALAMGEAPLDVKRAIWLHEQDELIGDPRAGGADHFSLVSKEARLFGITEEEIASAELHPFVIASFDAWIHLGRKSWLESLASTAVVEMVNSDAVISGGGHSSRIRQKLISELGIGREQLEEQKTPRGGGPGARAAFRRGSTQASQDRIGASPGTWRGQAIVGYRPRFPRRYGICDAANSRVWVKHRARMKLLAIGCLSASPWRSIP